MLITNQLNSTQTVVVLHGWMDLVKSIICFTIKKGSLIYLRPHLNYPSA